MPSASRGGLASSRAYSRQRMTEVPSTCSPLTGAAGGAGPGLGGGDAPPPAGGAADAGGAAAGAAAAGDAPAAPVPAAAPAAPAAPAVAPPAAQLPAVRRADAGAGAGSRSGCMPVLLILPFWAIVYVGAFGQPERRAGRSTRSSSAPQVYRPRTAPAATAPGRGRRRPGAGGRRGRKTFPNEADHVNWVKEGSAASSGASPTATRPARAASASPAAGGMPAFAGTLSDDEIAGRRPVRARRALSRADARPRRARRGGGGPVRGRLRLLAGRGRPRRPAGREEALPPGEDLRRRADAPGRQAARRHGPGRRPGRAPPLRRACARSPSARTLELQWPEHPGFPATATSSPATTSTSWSPSGPRRRAPTLWQEARGRRARSSTAAWCGARSVKRQGHRRRHRGGAGPLRGGRRRRQLPVRPGAGHARATAPTRWAWPSGATSRRPATTSRGSSRHLDIRDKAGNVLPGYGWIFPVGDGRVNVGIGLLSTFNQWKEVNTSQPDGRLRRLRARRRGASRPRRRAARRPAASCPWACRSGPRAGPTWLVTGDAGGAINPFNGEGIAYAYETGRMAAEVARRGAAHRRRPGAAGLRGPAAGRVRPLLQGGPGVREDHRPARADAGAGRHRHALAAR